MSLGYWVLGLLNGLTIGLLAVGLVLVYKANKFLNLAHAQMGAFSAMLVAKWVLDEGWNWWVAFLVAVAIGAGTGLAVEKFLIRPLRRLTQSPTRLLLLSLGVTQVLAALTYIKPLEPNAEHFNQFPQPFNSHLLIGHVVLTGTSILTAALVPVMVVALAVFMRYSLMGKQVRAAANNPDAARLCGISVSRVSAVTWGMAGGFAAVSAILSAPSQGGGFSGQSLGPYLLMLTLGAAALGAFVSLPMALMGGVVFGLVTQLASSSTSNGSNGELAAFALILVIIFLRSRQIAEVFDLSGTIVEDRPVTRVPAALVNDPLVKHHRALLAFGALCLGVLLPQIPIFHTAANEFLLSLIPIYAVIGIGLTMLLGWGGQVSLGQFGVVALGAFLTARWSSHAWSLPALILVVGLIGAAVLMLVGLPALRVRGLTLAVTTLGFSVIAADWLLHQSWVVGSQSSGGLVTSPRSQLEVYYVSLGVLVAALATASALRHSTRGRLITAVRDNEKASMAFGVNPAAVKLMILGVSGFFAGVAGVLWADAWKSVSVLQFTPSVSISLLALPVIGGLGSLAGVTVAAILQYGLAYALSPYVGWLFGNFGHNLGFTLFMGGLGQVSILLQAPQGLAGIAQRRWQDYLDRRAAQLTRQAEATAASPALKTDGIRVRFGGIIALDNPQIEVRPGEIVGLIGTNGAGKTTLINVISGLIPSEQGSVKVFGTEISDLAPDLRMAHGVGRSFQAAALFAGMTVTETIQTALSRRYRVGLIPTMLSAPWARQTETESRSEALAILERFGLTPFKDARVYELSTGTRRICDLAAQVAARPKLLLLDEPTAGVAQREAEAFVPLLRRIRDELDCSILIVEHDMPLLMRLCHRVYAMEAGAVIAQGTPEEIRVNPRVVASYLGTEEVAITRSGATGTRTSTRTVAKSRAVVRPRTTGTKKESGRPTSSSSRRTPTSVPPSS